MASASQREGLCAVTRARASSALNGLTLAWAGLGVGVHGASLFIVDDPAIALFSCGDSVLIIYY